MTVHSASMRSRGAYRALLLLFVLAALTATLRWDAAPRLTDVLPRAVPEEVNEHHHDHHLEEEATLPVRTLPTAVQGDTWVLDSVAASARWTTASGRAVQLGEDIEFAIRRNESYRVRTGTRVVAQAADGLFVELDEHRRRAVVGPPAPTGTPPVVPRPEARTRAEMPTNVDSLNLALAPSYWLRVSVLPFATSVRVQGEETIAGRLAYKVDLAFGGAAAAKWPDGWTWWIDKETGILLQYVLSGEDGPLDRFRMTSLSFADVTPDTEVVIPADFSVDVQGFDAAGRPAPAALRTTAPESARAVAARARVVGAD